MQKILYEEYDILSKKWQLDKNIPAYIYTNLNYDFLMREYQKEAYSRFVQHYQNNLHNAYPMHLLFNMATGSGKTFVMASLILELYQKWYRNFLFFVNSVNIIDKTRENFLNPFSSKYLFHEKIIFDGKIVNIKEVTNFDSADKNAINIKFTTIQWLHADISAIRENGVTYEDFKNEKVVFLSDEAHHINVTTKKWKLTNIEQEEKNSWENTVYSLLEANSENILLEFTATIDLENEFIFEKYFDKIIFKYSLREFRMDGYSKEVDILKSDMSQNDRILQALIVSQYRMKIAEKYKIFCKPVILFKAQKTVAESEKNKENFHNFIEKLSHEDIQKIKTSSNAEIIVRAFGFFEKNNLSIEDLIRELKMDFSRENCISANDDQETSKNQILLNSLEDRNNLIRAVFAVQKLNEWWDVLNLFDIVRLYDTRDGEWKKDGHYKPWKTTMSEAQLIGRGARYFPFFLSSRHEKYKRKFDGLEWEELKILETFYYHTTFDNKYISELKYVLVETWMIDEEKWRESRNEKILQIPFWKENIATKNTISIKNLSEIFAKKENFKIFLYTRESQNVKIFDVNSQEIRDIDRSQDAIKKLKIQNIDRRIIRKAIAKNNFYRFDNLEKYIKNFHSLEEFIVFLIEQEIDIFGTPDDMKNFSRSDLLMVMNLVLSSIEQIIRQ